MAKDNEVAGLLQLLITSSPRLFGAVIYFTTIHFFSAKW
jgi:hypothetical protein